MSIPVPYVEWKHKYKAEFKTVVMSNIAEFDKKVTELLNDGWTLHGTTCFADRDFSQSLTRMTRNK